MQVADYDVVKTNELVEGFSSGFLIHYNGPNQEVAAQSHISVAKKISVVHAKLEKVLKMNRIAGPFEEPPLDNLRISPLGCVPKKEQNSIIHDLSYPKGNSINAFIPQEFTKVKYENLDNVISLVQKISENSLIAKLDIEDAFRIMPIDPNDYHLLGFTFGQQYFYARCLPMGCSTACQTFEKFSQALQWLLINHFEISGITHILDDFIFVGPSNSNLCQSALETFLVLAEDVNVPIKKDKTT